MEILELALQTNNLMGTKTFNQQTIGFKIVDETENLISFRIGYSKLIFKSINNNLNPKYHFAFNIPTNKIEEAIEWTSQRAKLIHTKNESIITDFENWNAKAIYFFDNNQNILEFISRTDLNNPTDKEFSIETVLNINEVGLVVDRPIKIGEDINRKVATDFFAKGPKRDDFAAVGDEIGLFVISNPNRKWYPTEQLAERWKIKTVIKIDGTEHELEFN
ncbi:MAG: VOC family protein [Bacteroidetes bacterium]|nr:VOC family protein [Bacteroidota bacterium]